MSIFIKILLKCCLQAIFLVLIGCNYSSKENFEHEPSKRFYSQHEFDANYLDSYRVEDVLFVMEIKQINYSNYIVWLELYSKHKDKLVGIKKVSIDGDEMGGMFKGGKEYSLDLPVGDDIFYKKTIKLFDLNKENLVDVIKSKRQMNFLVYYEIGNASGVLEFNVQLKTEKSLVFPT